MNGIGTNPLLQFIERPAKVFEDLAIDVLDIACRRHDGDEPGNGFDDQPEAVLAGQSLDVARARIG